MDICNKRQTANTNANVQFLLPFCVVSKRLDFGLIGGSGVAIQRA